MNARSIAGLIALLFILASAPLPAAVLITQVYGGGGQPGGPYSNDYIELFNAGLSGVSVAGWSVQFTSPSGEVWSVTPLTGSIAPHHFYLVGENSGGGGGTPLPTPDAIGSIDLWPSSGKVALVSSTAALSGGCPTAGVVDRVGYGGTDCFYGSGAAPTVDNSKSAQRFPLCLHTNDDARDFVAATPLAHNSSTATLCPPPYPLVVQNIVGLVGYWRFEGDLPAWNTVGASGGNFIGDAAKGDDASGPALRDAFSNSAVLLDGNGDGVASSIAPMWTFASAASIVAWIRLDIQPSTAGRIFYIAGRSQLGNDMDLQIDTDNILRFYTSNGGSVAAPAALPLHQWVMVAASFGASNERSLYIDGRLVSKDTPGVHSANSNTGFYIGYTPVFPGRWFQGAIDEVAVFNNIVGDAQVRRLAVVAGEPLFRAGFEY
jgi:Concanavalin A-like lectin/glucanases superfamily